MNKDLFFPDEDVSHQLKNKLLNIPSKVSASRKRKLLIGSATFSIFLCTFLLKNSEAPVNHDPQSAVYIEQVVNDFMEVDDLNYDFT